MNYREEIEHFLVTNFNGRIKPLTVSDIEVINKFKGSKKEPNFGFGFCAFMLYSNGLNERSLSNFAPMGLLYNDEQNIFSIGIFKKEDNPKDVYIHIIAPVGNNWCDAINEIQKLISSNFEDVVAIYVRHLCYNDYINLRNQGFVSIRDMPWNNISHSEDETFNHRLIEIEKIIGEANGKLYVKKLDVQASKNFKTKTKQAYQRFENFLNNSLSKFNFAEYTPNDVSFAMNIVNTRFDSLLYKVGSTPNDYYNLINNAFCDNENIFSYIGFLCSNSICKPVALFIGEKISVDCVALYATIAVSDNPYDETHTESVKGYSAISQYCYVRVFENLYSNGIRYVDLGGSELEKLDKFKRQLGAVEKKTYWAVKSLRKALIVV